MLNSLSIHVALRVPVVSSTWADTNAQRMSLLIDANKPNPVAAKV